MRYIGLRPAIAHDFVPGIGSGDLRNRVINTSISWLTSLIPAQISPRSFTVVWSQGESEAMGSAGTGQGTAWANSTRTSFAALRTAFGSDLNIIIAQLATEYIPSMSLPALADVCQSQVGLAAENAHNYLVEIGPATTGTTGIHLDFAALWRQSSLVAAKIKSLI
jgi:hypothetical protein